MPHDPALDWDCLLRTVQDDEPELYRAWFADLPPGEIDRGVLEVRVEDLAQAHYLHDHCREAFTHAAMKFLNLLVTVRFVCPLDPTLSTIATTAPQVLTTLRLGPD